MDIFTIFSQSTNLTRNILYYKQEVLSTIIHTYITHDQNYCYYDYNCCDSQTKPYGMVKLSSNTLEGNDRYEGFGIDLIKELSEMSGFNYTFIIQEDFNSGYINETTKKWTGMIGEVINGVSIWTNARNRKIEQLSQEMFKLFIIIVIVLVLMCCRLYNN